MTEQEILDYNARCAEFLGGVYDSDMTKYWFHLPIKWEGTFAPTTEDLKFHSDWNWIMLVVEKVLDVCLKLDTMEMYYNITDSVPDLKFTANAINEFLIWYNKNKQP